MNIKVKNVGEASRILKANNIRVISKKSLQGNSGYVEVDDISAKSLLGGYGLLLQENKKSKLSKLIKEQIIKYGSNVGNRVYLTGKYADRFPAEDGYYGIIEDVTPASNYNTLANYHIEIRDANDKYVGSFNSSWGKDFTDKEPYNQKQHTKSIKNTVIKNDLQNAMVVIHELSKKMSMNGMPGYKSFFEETFLKLQKIKQEIK